jgi:hypothetical protein
MSFLSDIEGFVEKHREHPTFSQAMKTLAGAREAVAEAAMGFMGWSQEGKLELVPLAANRFLEMMSELTVGWLLLDAAMIAEGAGAKLVEGHPDRAFYAGKKAAALYFARGVLPGVLHKRQLLAAEDQSPMEIPVEGFATV